MAEPRNAKQNGIVAAERIRSGSIAGRPLKTLKLLICMVIFDVERIRFCRVGAAANVLDLFAEFRNLRNGLGSKAGWGLLGALAHFGLDGVASAHKDAMRDLILTGGPWDAGEREAILRYCAEDVEAAARLLMAMRDRIDLPRAFLRGHYMGAVARMEWATCSRRICRRIRSTATSPA